MIDIIIIKEINGFKIPLQKFAFRREIIGSIYDCTYVYRWPSNNEKLYNIYCLVVLFGWAISCLIGLVRTLIFRIMVRSF